MSVVSWSPTAITVIVPNQATTGGVTVSVAGVASNSDRIFTVVGAPNITSISPTSGVAGDPVTITGTNFGATQGANSTVTFNGQPVTIDSWSNTVIHVTVSAVVPTGAGPVVVTTSGVASNFETFTMLLGPTLTSVEPSSVYRGTTIDVSFAGTNLTNITASSINYSGAGVVINSASGTGTTATANITFTSSAQSGLISITTAGGRTTDLGIVVSSAPVGPGISWIAPLAVAQGSMNVVTIRGIRLTDASEVAFSSPGMGIENPPTVADDTRIVTIALPDNTASSGRVSVVTPLGESNSLPIAVLPAGSPVITRLVPNFGLPGSIVSLWTQNSGSSQGSSTLNAPMTVRYWTNISVSATVNSGAATGDITITVGGRVSNAVRFYVQPTPPAGIPVISELVPNSGAVGTSFQIRGTDFGNTFPADWDILLGTTSLHDYVSAWSNNQIVATVPPGATSGDLFVLIAGGGTNALPFTVLTGAPPLIVNQGMITFPNSATRELASICGGITIPDGTHQGSPGISLFCKTAWYPAISLAVNQSVTISGTSTAIDGTAYSYNGTYTVAGLSTGPDNYGMTLLA